MSEQVNQERTKGRKKLTLERAYFSALSLALAFVVYINVVSALGALSGFCGLCHASEHRGLSDSGHTGINCNVCHGGSSVFGVLSGRAKLARMIPSQLTGLYRRPVSTTVFNNTCLSCHDHINKQVIETEDIRVSHKEIIEAKYSCGDCHSTVAHGKAAVRQNFAELGKCLTCHNNAGTSGSCDICHIKNGTVEPMARIEGSWQISHGENWRKTHGMGNLNTCQACHSKLYCSRCHGIELPHSQAWLTTHGAEIKRSKLVESSCNQCHVGALCKNCHGMDVPHPKSFLPDHSKIVKRDGDKACYNCHLKEACTTCHEYHVHQGIPQEKLKLLRKEVGLD